MTFVMIVEIYFGDSRDLFWPVADPEMDQRRDY
jgi:hypothetical protein